jgi:predicted Zn finger-like uncharacterized protein
MKITCQSCQSKYNVADEKVQGKIVKIRCRKCGATIVVQGNGQSAGANGSAAGAASPASGAADDGAQWHVNMGEGEPRTMALAELVEAYNSGAVAQDTFIWTDGMDDWKPLSEVEAVVSALHGAAAAPAPAPAVAEPAYRAPAEEAFPAPASAFPAPAAAPVMAAAAAEAPAPEPRRAAVKREATRARDLFASGTGGEEVQTSAPVVPQMMSASAVDDASGKLTGQRNENSVLFSLAVLTKDAGGRVEDEAPKPTSKNTDDSGLIDLKALAAKAESFRPPATAEANAFSAPLGLGTPLGAPMGVLGGPLGSEAPPKSKVPLIIGMAAGTVLLIVLGIFIGVKVIGGSTPAPEASAIASAPAVTASAPAEPSATAAPSASAEAAASAAASATVAAKPKAPGAGVYHAPGGGAKPAGGTAAASTGGGGGGGAATPTPPPPKKAGNDCGCNGDLMCLMKCSTH